MKLKTIIGLIASAVGITFTSLTFNDLFFTGNGSEYIVYSGVIFNERPPTTMIHGYTTNRYQGAHQNNPVLSSIGSLIPSTVNPFTGDDIGTAQHSRDNDYSFQGYDASGRYSKKNASSINVVNNELYASSYASHKQRTEVQLTDIGSSQPTNLYTGNQRQGVLSTTGNNNEDPFEEGGGTDPNNGYNDVPVGDANWFLMLLLTGYVLVKYKSPVKKWLTGLKFN